MEKGETEESFTVFDEEAMQMALQVARSAVEKKEVPVSCIFVRKGEDGSPEVICGFHNMTTKHRNVISRGLGHAPLRDHVHQRAGQDRA